jgi:hypothetical protein
LTEDGVSSLKRAVKNDCFLVKRFQFGYVFYIIKHAAKKMTRLLYKGNENMEHISGNEESAIFDRSFDTLASEIETNVLKALKVVTMSVL